ncbi:hypothetical protein [Pseudomarimonas salicorniae]|uniref:Uncharacterized protein n=1 Tax=Pseudomarimonas salicorniae TaxID=2933270 RepID=A0ABT0GFY4_9GAMM|nr:hypothetical protein [Lysobacter sp. CAU 1642]MCK7593450.1 hypothetical protein [Lysobacter sp. CAU 1642]
MKRLLTAAILTLAAAGAASANSQGSLHPVYAEAGQFTAMLDRDAQQWRLAPIVGEAIDVRSAELCPSTIRPVPGLWLVGRDEQGQPQLIAPSATLLPEGHSGRVALRRCDDPALREASVEAYGVPGKVLDWLVSESGAVLVDD